MKLIIRDEKPKEDAECEIWLEMGGDDVYVQSRVKGGKIKTELILMSDMKNRKSIFDGSNFKWGEE